MTIETRYAVKEYGEIVFVCESHDDAIAVAKAFEATNDNDFEKYVVEVPYLADNEAGGDDDDDSSISVYVLRHGHGMDDIANDIHDELFGGEADD